MAYRYKNYEQPIRFENLKYVWEIGPDDDDTFALDSDGNILQKQTSFSDANSPAVISWVPMNGGHCQQGSPIISQLIEEYGGDPRTAFSAPEVQALFGGGNPDEKLSR